MEYIRSLREKIGKEPIIGCSAIGIILNDKNQILLQKRTDTGEWGNPGGSIELGETLEEALKREVKEETGLDIENPKFFNIYSGENQHITYPNGDEVYYVTAVYIVNDFSGELVANEEESEELEFFDFNNIPENQTKTLRKILEDYK